MKTNQKKSFLSGIPPWGLAGIALLFPILFMLLLFVLGELMMNLNGMNEDLSASIIYILMGLFNVTCCFFIVRQNPRTIWYVPILCNAVGIFSATGEPNFWISSMWVIFCGGWVLSVITSVWGYYSGNKSLA